MQVSIWWVLAAVWGGGILGVIIMCLLNAAGRDRWERDEYEQRMDSGGHF